MTFQAARSRQDAGLISPQHRDSAPLPPEEMVTPLIPTGIVTGRVETPEDSSPHKEIEIRTGSPASHSTEVADSPPFMSIPIEQLFSKPVDHGDERWEKKLLTPPGTGQASAKPRIELVGRVSSEMSSKVIAGDRISRESEPRIEKPYDGQVPSPTRGLFSAAQLLVPDANTRRVDELLNVTAGQSGDSLVSDQRNEETSTSSPPLIKVTIGRIDVKAVTPQHQQPRRAEAPKPRISLEEYLRPHDGRHR